MNHKQITIKEADNGYVVEMYNDNTGEMKKMVAKDIPEAQKMMMAMMSEKMKKGKSKGDMKEMATPKVAKFYK